MELRHKPAASLGPFLLEVYRCLFHRYGPQGWWPGETPFEVIVGAILTQAAAWGNVEKAIRNLKQDDALSAAALRALSEEALSHLIYPSGYYQAKARKLKAFTQRLGQAYGDSLAKLFSLETAPLRHELLSIYGIGEETADSILLYAADRPVFVVDAYTRRIFLRLEVSPKRDSYSAWQALFMGHLPPESQLYNEYHALLVRHGKTACLKQPRCEGCCLQECCAYNAEEGKVGKGEKALRRHSRGQRPPAPPAPASPIR